MLVALRTVMLGVLVRALSCEDGLLLYKRGGFYCVKVLFSVGMSYKCKYFMGSSLILVMHLQEFV
jgi:hypothetical protein